MRLPVSVGFDLEVRIGEAVAPLSPRQGLRLAEVLIRRSCRALLAEELRASRRGRSSNRVAVQSEPPAQPRPTGGRPN
jgi:hypothetical protein